jgi:NADH-quinone oxidoreductase subunit E
MSESAGAECRRNSWLVALAGGALVALMLLIVAHYGVLKALVIGLVFAVALGVFIVWAFCSRPAEAAAPADEREPNPAPEPGPVPEPSPVVEPASAPAPQTERKAEAGKPSAPPAFVSAQPATRPVAAPEPVAPAPAVAGQPARRKRASSAGLDAALAKSKDEPPAPAPEMLSAPRGGRADDLKQIKGIGPKLEALLNEVGVWHFDQIASWKARDIAHVDELLVGFRGRITRDKWVKQAKVLAAGGTTEFSQRVKKGDVY